MNLKRALWMLPVAAGIVTSGCATHAGTGAAAGGLLGAATGAVIGSQGGDAGAGALIGGALGSIGGTLVGAGMDENDRRNEARIAAATAKPVTGPTSVADVVHMVQSGVGDDVIISSIRSSGSLFVLNASDVVTLHNSGVSDRVIQAMLDSSRRVGYAQPVIVDRRPVHVIEAPPRVSVGFGYYRRPHWHHHHCW